MSDSDDEIPLANEGEDDLFGDGGEHLLTDNEGTGSVGNPESDQDHGAREEEHDDDDDDDGDNPNEVSTVMREKLISVVSMYRHRIPRSSDGGLQCLRVPEFLKFNPAEYKAETWEPSKWDRRNAEADQPVQGVHCRRDPAAGKMQSNTNIYRWSDGSVTLSVGDEHFEIQTKPLAPPRGKPYQEVQDAHYYAAAAHLTSNSLLIVGHFTEQYTVRPNQEIQDDAVEQLKQGLAAQRQDRSAEMIITTTEDPELQKKQAELAEKERVRAQRRRENAAARATGTEMGGRYKGGSGGVLSIGDLETGRRGAAAGRKRGSGGAQQRKKHRRPEYDSDDDLPDGARRAQDNYDLDDGFIVPSGDEFEEDDDDVNDSLDDDDDERRRWPSKKRQKTDEPENEDVDAEGEDDHVDVHPAATSYAQESSSRRRRNVIDDDDDE